MTVCIAAIYDNKSILGVSDRMLTGGDIQFEPPTPKIFNITNSIAILTAGDSSMQAQLVQKAYEYAADRVTADPGKWLSVKEVAYFYRNSYIEIRREAAERTILSPYGLTSETFISKQKDMSPELVKDIAYRLENFALVDEDVATIIAGIDDDPHIFVIVNDRVVCADRIGFAAVGSGSNHANSHFMLSGYSAGASETKALLTIHRAKKKSEVSPGVGEQTDMFVIGPNPGTFNKLEAMPAIGVDLVKDLDGFYREYTDEISKLDVRAEAKIQEYLSQMVTKRSPAQKAEPPVNEEPKKPPTSKPPKKPKR